MKFNIKSLFAGLVFLLLAIGASAQGITTRVTLKTYFETGDRPTSSQYQKLIDSYFHLTEDSLALTKLEGVDGVLNTNTSLTGATNRNIASTLALKTYIDNQVAAGQIKFFTTRPTGNATYRIGIDTVGTDSLYINNGYPSTGAWSLLATGSGGGGSATDLGYTQSTRVLTSSTGADVTLPTATNALPGLLPAPSGLGAPGGGVVPGSDLLVLSDVSSGLLAAPTVDAVVQSVAAGGDMTGTINNLQIASGAVESAEIAANAVGNSEMADNAVGSAEIIAESIAAVDIDTGAVTTSEILDATIAYADLSQAVKDSIAAGGGGGSTTLETIYVLLAGQSNAWGASAGFQGDTSNVNNIQVWDETTSQWKRATIGQTPFRVSGYNQGASSSYNNSNNLGLHFCNRLQEYTGRPVRLILYPKDGNSLSQWTDSTKPNFTDMDSRVTAAIGSNKVDIFLWHQGEADQAQTESWYLSRFDTLKADLRAQPWFTPTTPIIVGGMVPGGSFFGKDSTLQKLDYSNDVWVGYASSANLTANGIDNFHFGGSSLVTMGAERYFQAYLGLPLRNIERGKNLSGSGGGSGLPSGTNGQTLRNNSGTWEATNVLTNDGTSLTMTSTAAYPAGSYKSVNNSTGAFLPYGFHTAPNLASGAWLYQLLGKSATTGNMLLSGLLWDGDNAASNRYTAQWLGGDYAFTFRKDGKNGIGNVVNPQNPLDVEGGVAIGASYSGATAAPTNGAIIEGQTIIGGTSVIAGESFSIQGSRANTTIATLRNSAANGYSSLFGYNSDGTHIIGFGVGNASASNWANQGFLGTNTSSGFNLYTANTSRMYFSPAGQIGVGVGASPTARFHLPAGTTAASTAFLKFTSGPLLTTKETGAWGFLTDKLYFTITTGTAEKEVTLNDAALTSGKIPVATTNGRLTDSAIGVADIWQVGGNSLGATAATIGTNDVRPLHFETNNTRRMSIPSGGIASTTTATKALMLSSNDSLQYMTVQAGAWSDNATLSNVSRTDTVLNGGVAYGRLDRKGNMVFFTLRFEVGLGADTTSNIIFMPLPVASNFTSPSVDCMGTAQIAAQGVYGGNPIKVERTIVYADDTGDRIAVGYTVDRQGATYPTNRVYISVSGSYEIK